MPLRPLDSFLRPTYAQSSGSSPSHKPSSRRGRAGFYITVYATQQPTHRTPTTSSFRFSKARVIPSPTTRPRSKWCASKRTCAQCGRARHPTIRSRLFHEMALGLWSHPVRGGPVTKRRRARPQALAPNSAKPAQPMQPGPRPSRKECPSKSGKYCGLRKASPTGCESGLAEGEYPRVFRAEEPLSANASAYGPTPFQSCRRGRHRHSCPGIVGERISRSSPRSRTLP